MLPYKGKSVQERERDEHQNEDALSGWKHQAVGTAVLQAGLAPSLALTSAVLGCLCTGNGDPLWNAGSTRGAQRQDPLPAAPRGVFTLRAEGSLNRQV